LREWDVFDFGYDNSPTFADGTRTRPAGFLGLRMYVLARFQSNASFDWVARVRAALVKDELKYRDLVATGFDLILRRFPAFVSEDLCRLLIREAASATIFLADSEPYAVEVFQSKHQEGAEFAVDFGFQDVIRETSERMIKQIPLYRLSPFDI